jgi:diguanylate cyclase
LHYQPKVTLASRQLTSVEALVRWDHPQRGLLPPDDFIHLAEHTGLINSLSMWAIGAGLRQSHALQEAGLQIPVAVNLSVLNLLDPHLPDRIEYLLDHWQADPRLLMIEITESAIMANVEQSLTILNRLRAMGLRLAIDDFGTGYSALSYLRRLPVDEIKIDQSFVKDMARDENDAAIVRSVIELGHSLGLQVIAEGVEDQATCELLQRLGCDVAQGYYICRPMAATDLIDWVAQTQQPRPNALPLA